MLHRHCKRVKCALSDVRRQRLFVTRHSILYESSEAFSYTSGRWLYNEALRLSERYQWFNIPALLDTAARAIGQDIAEVQSFRKLAEGGFNRMFELTMRDGAEIIARMPYPLMQPKRLAVASEVATMDFARRHGISTPKVLGYSADAGNPVGTEYILMEKLRGKPLGDIWFTMSGRDRAKVLSSIVDSEAKLFALDLPANGSIFYDRDLPRSFSRVPLFEEFCVGLDVSFKNWFEVGAAPLDVLHSAAAKELAFLRTYGKPRMPFERNYRDITDFQKSSPQDHAKSLEKYMNVASHLVPHQSWLCKPTLRHPDLNPNNVFVTDEHEFLALIDWQHAKILSLLLCAGIPGQFQNYGDADSEQLVRPQLPAGLDQMDDDDRESELEQYRRRHLHFCYTAATAQKNKPNFDAIMHDRSLFRRKIYEHAVAPWEGENLRLMADLVHLAQNWSDIVGDDSTPPASLAFDEQESVKILDGALKQAEVDQQLEILRGAVGGAGVDGWIPTDEFEHAKAEAARLKAKALELADDDEERDQILKYWPFDDFDEKE